MKKWLIIIGVIAGSVGFFRAGFVWQTRLNNAYNASVPIVSLQGELAEASRAPLTPDPDAKLSAEEWEQLTALGYLSGYEEATEERGITVHDSTRTHAGLNLFTSGHAPEAYLMDMEGAVQHTWRYPFEDIWPDNRPDGNVADFWRRAHVFENGDLLAIFETVGLIKVDKDSNLLWAKRNAAHHDLHVHDDGTIYVLTQKFRSLDWYRGGQPVLDDFVTVLSAEGEELRKFSVLESFGNSAYRPILENAAERGEVLHTNALKFLDGRHADRSPIFKRGNILLSIRELGVLAIVDLEGPEMVWAMSGMWLLQHDPTLLDNGNVMLFDNLGYENQSKIVEFDPLTQEVAWTYGMGEGERLRSVVCGSVERLANGNTLINEACRGRVLEVTSGNDIVWEFMNPHRPIDNDNLRATILNFTRMPESFAPDWLD